jgi:hypothetical protein
MEHCVGEDGNHLSHLASGLILYHTTTCPRAHFGYHEESCFPTSVGTGSFCLAFYVIFLPHLAEVADSRWP